MTQQEKSKNYRTSLVERFVHSLGRSTSIKKSRKCKVYLNRLQNFQQHLLFLANFRDEALIYQYSPLFTTNGRMWLGVSQVSAWAPNICDWRQKWHSMIHGNWSDQLKDRYTNILKNSKWHHKLFILSKVSNLKRPVQENNRPWNLTVVTFGDPIASGVHDARTTESL